MNKLLFMIALILIVSCNTEQSKENLDENIDPFPIAEFLNKTAKPSQRFTISADRDTLIVGEKGTKIFIPERSFVSNTGEDITDKVTIELREYYSLVDFISEDIPPIEDFSSLGGIFYINATNEDQNVLLNNPIKIKAPIISNNNITLPKLFVKDTIGEEVTWSDQESYPIIKTEVSFLESEGEVVYFDSTGNITNERESNYILTTLNLGWLSINSKLNLEVIDTLRITNPTINSSYYIIIKELNAYRIAKVHGDKSYFTSIPINFDKYILCLNYKDSNMNIGYNQLSLDNTYKSINGNIKLNRVKTSQLKEELSKLIN